MLRRLRKPRTARAAAPESSEARQTLLGALGQTRTLIAQAYLGFNSTCDPDLIESYVFEINALRARYSYLLRQVKALEQPSVCLETASTVR